MATSKKQTAKLLYADSEKCADMLYLSGLFVPDPFLALDMGDRRVGVLNALEVSRARKESRFDEVLAMDEVLAAVRKSSGKRSPRMVDIVRWLLRELSVTHVEVARDFPAGLALELKQARVSLSVAEGGLYPEREIKSAEACAEIQKGNAASAHGIRTAERILRASTIRDGFIIYEGKRLTSERLRFFIETACLEKGALPAHTIVAGGDQACDPHCAGSGALRANSLIIVDVFPRLTRSGYFGDLTRTFLKGRASEAQKKLVHTVKEGQARALAKIRAGVEAETVHGAVTEYFEKQDYKTEVRGGTPVGFFHSTGHGLGLDIHEAPRLSPAGSKLRSGMVVTVEPGLYYPGLGGCRIEDVVCVEPKGYRYLSKLHYSWQIR